MLADALDVKRPEIHAKPFLWKYSGIGLVCFECQQRENYRKATAKLLTRKTIIQIRRLKTN
jgi:hypothetical protein